MNGNSESKALAVRGDDAFTRALEPTSFEGAMKCADMIHKAGIGGCKNPEEVLIKLMAGRAQGLTAIDSLRLVYVVNGRPSFDATFIRAKCLRLPDCEYFEPKEITPTKVTFRAKRVGRPEVEFSFGIEDAQRAGLHSKETYKAWPISMFSARATTILARMLFPEAVAGLYSPDEMEHAIDAHGEPVIEQPTPEQLDELTGELVQTAAPVDHGAVVDSLKSLIDEAKASGDVAARKRVVESIKAADLPSAMRGDVRKHYVEAFGAKGAAA